jgi:type I restriction enzyme R subunit
VTWRLADSLPQSKLAQWQAERDAWQARHPEPWDDATKREYRERFTSQVERWLDAGHGSCVLRHPDCAETVAGALRYFNGDRYVLGAFVVMPNHVHVLFRPTAGYDMSGIAHSWKSFTAKAINRILGRTGTLWQQESWDRMVRNEAQFEACLNYIQENPKFAGLSGGEYVVERFIEIDDHPGET